jgi:tetratricopeptide (TPR) repeat protein
MSPSEADEYRHGTDLFIEGFSLSSDEVAGLLEQVENDPGDLDSRLMLVSHFQIASEMSGRSCVAHLKLVLWLVSRHSGAKWADSPHLEIDQRIDPNGFAAVRARWLEQVDAQPTSARVRANAAAFVGGFDNALAERLLEEAKSLEPDEAEWPRQLGHFHGLQLMWLEGEERRNLAKLALAEYERAFALTDDEMGRYTMLDDLGMLALDAGDDQKAERFAKQLLAISQAPEGNWNSGNAVHKGSIILGRVALRAGDIESARVKLLEAGKTSGSPNLDSFGPNMSLAKELIERGERDVVIEYFRLCRRFWIGDEPDAALDEWTAIVATGGMPQFGANLHY